MLCFDKTCYTCLKSNNKQLVGLLKLDNDNVTYMDKLMSVSPVLVQMQDRKMELCISCIKKLRISYQFKQMVMESQVTLQKYSEVNNSDFEDKLNLDSLSSDLFNSHVKSDCDNLIDSKMNDRHFKEDDTESDSDSKCNDDTDFSVEDNETEITKLCTTNKVKNRDKSNKDITSISASLQCDNQSERKVDISSTKTEPFDSGSDSVRIDDAEKESIRRPKKKYNVKPKPVLNYFCEMCGSDFDKRWKLQKHKIRVHVDDRKHMCSFCNKNFKTAYHLREHMTSHTGERKYMCNYCEKSFQRLSSLKRHIHSHEAAPGEKTKKTPFLCNICGKNFPYSNGVQRHMRIHFGIKNHVCTICNRRFTQSTHLHVHMRTHTGEKPFICDTCGDAFSLNAGLQKHMNVHKRNALKSCEIDPVDIYLIKNERDF